MKISVEEYQAQAKEEALDIDEVISYLYQTRAREDVLDILDEVISYLKKADERKLVIKLRDVENYIRCN